MNTTIKEIPINSWSEFETALGKIREEKREKETQTSRQFPTLLFRGVGSDGWGLETTLERSFPDERRLDTLSLVAYYRNGTNAQPALETFTGTRWQGILSYPDFERELSKRPGMLLDIMLSKEVALLEYLVYLRHHGFPSPLLDWTASPYIAAFFAFDAPPPGSTRVSVFGLLQGSIRSADSSAKLFVVGPYMRSHPRHVLQQCQYSICTRLRTQPFGFDFVRHEHGVGGAVGIDGELFKITVPVEQRVEALRRLDLMNINAYSLFGTEESLVKTIGRRELLLNER